MTRTKRIVWIVGLAAGVAGWCGAGFGSLADVPRKGSHLPPLSFGAPATPENCAYLGVDAGKSFDLADVQADLIVLEIIGVYCPQCHQQRPNINRLYHRVQKDAALAGRVKFLGVAVGASAKEAAYLVRDTHIPYPIVIDESFAIHKQLGEPRTPFNLVSTREGAVLWAHLGIIDDMNAFYATLKSLADR